MNTIANNTTKNFSSIIKQFQNTMQSNNLNDQEIKAKIAGFGSSLQNFQQIEKTTIDQKEIKNTLNIIIQQIITAKDAKSTASIFGQGTTNLEENLFLLKSAISVFPINSKQLNPFLITIDQAIQKNIQNKSNSYFHNTEEKEKTAILEGRRHLGSKYNDHKAELYPESSVNKDKSKDNKNLVIDTKGNHYKKVEDTVFDGNCGLQAYTKAFNDPRPFEAIRKTMHNLVENYYKLQVERGKSDKSIAIDKNVIITAYKTIFNNSFTNFKSFMLTMNDDKLKLPDLKPATKINQQRIEKKLQELSSFDSLTEIDCKDLFMYDLGIELDDILADKLKPNWQNLNLFYNSIGIQDPAKDIKSDQQLKTINETYQKACINGNWLTLSEIRMLALYHGFILDENLLNQNDATHTILKFQSLQDKTNIQYIANNAKVVNIPNGTHWVCVKPINF